LILSLAVRTVSLELGNGVGHLDALSVVARATVVGGAVRLTRADLTQPPENVQPVWSATRLRPRSGEGRAIPASV